jgi:hypothetical protein
VLGWSAWSKWLQGQVFCSSRIKQVLMVSDRSFGRFELVEKNVKLNWEQ